MRIPTICDQLSGTLFGLVLKEVTFMISFQQNQEGKMNLRFRNSHEIYFISFHFLILFITKTTNNKPLIVVYALIKNRSRTHEYTDLQQYKKRNISTFTTFIKNKKNPSSKTRRACLSKHRRTPEMELVPSILVPVLVDQF